MRLLLGTFALTLATTTACSGTTDQPDGADPTTPAPSTSSASVAPPTELGCAEAERRYVAFDYGGDRSFTELLTTWTAELGRPYVDRARRTIWFLREDGTAHTALTWARARGAENGREWFVDGYEQCQGAKPDTRLGLADGPEVDLAVGHCVVEPVDVDGRSWDVVAEDQFGTGGGQPRTISGSGTLHPAGDVMVFVDDEGGRLTLVPERDPWTVSLTGCR